MNHEQIKKIVQEVFEKAKRGSVSHSKYALAKQVVKEINHLNPKTLERAYSRYIERNDAISTPNPDTVAFFCKYIGYNDYEEYVSKKSTKEVINPTQKTLTKERRMPPEKKDQTKKKYKWSLTFKIVFAFGAIMALTNYLSKKKNMQKNYSEAKMSIQKDIL